MASVGSAAITRAMHRNLNWQRLFALSWWTVLVVASCWFVRDLLSK
jgi:hypothetical protein